MGFIQLDNTEKIRGLEQELADLKQLVRWAVKEYDKGDDVWGAIQKLKQAVEDKTNLPSWSNDAY